MMKHSLMLALLTLVAPPAWAKLSPAEQKIEWAEKAIEKDPGRFQAYNELAVALARRARETSDVGYYLRGETALRKSLELMPDNLEGRKAQVWILLGKHEFADALKLAKELNRKFPDDESLERAGRLRDAKRMYLEFESKARQELKLADNANRELVFYYADHAGKPAEALRIAQLEVARRHDIYTLDACAWALYVNGRYPEAQKQIETALAVGVRDAKLLYHAGAIALKLKHAARARQYWKQSLELNPTSECAGLIRRELQIDARSGRSRSS